MLLCIYLCIICMCTSLHVYISECLSICTSLSMHLYIFLCGVRVHVSDIGSMWAYMCTCVYGTYIVVLVFVCNR